MRNKVKAGDVFLIPLEKTTSAGGMVISAWKHELYIVVFEEKFANDQINIPKILSGKPMFLTLTLDAKLWNGDWPIVGNELEQTKSFPQPSFKVQSNGTEYIESLDRKVCRVASDAESQILRYRKISSPAIIDEATKGKFGIVEWNSYYDALLAHYAIESSKLLR